VKGCLCDPAKGVTCVYHPAQAKMEREAAEAGTPLVTVLPSAFTVCAIPERFGPNWYRNYTLTVERLSVEDRWRIVHTGYYLTDGGDWTPDRMRAWYGSQDEALERARRVAPDVVVGMMTARKAAQMLTAREVSAQDGATP